MKRKGYDSRTISFLSKSFFTENEEKQMPNGVDRNFVRYMSCISGFRAKFNHWPTRVRLDSSFVEELKEVMRNEDFQRMNEKITIIPDNSNPWDGLYVAEDEEGNSYDLMQHGHGPRELGVRNWLGIRWPDYGPD